VRTESTATFKTDSIWERFGNTSRRQAWTAITFLPRSTIRGALVKFRASAVFSALGSSLVAMNFIRSSGGETQAFHEIAWPLTFLKNGPGAIIHAEKLLERYAY
jgi:hypothetical protein